MATEIERKFLLASDDWRPLVSRSEYLAQGYLGGARCSVRVRIGGERAWLNIKSMTLGAQRLEFEYPIPLADAHTMLRELADGPVVSKTRHHVRVGRHLWEIDEFDGDNTGLVVAEIELDAVDEAFDLPSWLGEEVTEDARYYNINLARQPYCRWESR
ncbi:MAG: CYTH domain-containing protein [Xanthomonadales bacterium]|nr:Inorganic triphosphatase [Xanthomonadales bacterium]MCC6594394.1 CYTH domain-containing protein [Xanthomonadales bacterium]MCE7932120.1 CYTH domain-containing protein [Xanthomonadales bacterium PRO6]